MPARCVVGGCSNFPDVKKGIGLHRIPFAGDERPEARKRWKRWVAFVKSKRAKWEPTTSSCVCSAHFKGEDFERLFTVVPGQQTSYLPRLKRDEIGIVSFPARKCKTLRARKGSAILKDASPG